MGIRNHPKSSPQLAHHATKEKDEKRPALKQRTWNVRTMLTGICEILQDVSDSRKTAVINNELMRLNVDIATLQETRLADSGALKEKDYTFYWQGKGSGEHREYGVGFHIRNSLLSMIEPGSNGSERLYGSTPLQNQSPLSACMPLQCPQHRIQKTSSTRTSQPSSATSPTMNNLFSWATSMLEWVQITTRGSPALESSALVKLTRMDSDCSSCALTMTCASPTHTFGRSPSTRFPGDTRAQSIDTNWI